MGSSPTQITLLEHLDAGIMRLTLNRPQHRNAIDAGLREELEGALARAATDDGIRGVIVCGGEGNFCAGGDLASFEELQDARVYRQVSHRLTDVVESIERLEKPVVAAIDGVVIGAGLALALACDWRVGAPGTRILFREGAVGLIPAHGGVTRLVKLLGLARAKEVLLGGDELDAGAAYAADLLSELVDDSAALLDAAQRRVERMLARAPLSFAAAKRLLALAADVDQRSATVAESLAQTALLQSDDHREGLAAARERRAPRFTGR
jgi:enoyl-CoA hydratase/carnithine racemase